MSLARCWVVLALSAVPLAAQLSPVSALWPLDAASGQVANDLGPFGNQGTLVNFAGNPWGSGVVGNALTFDGLDDYVDIAPMGGLPVYDGTGTPYSITFWVKGPPQNDVRCYSEGVGQAQVGGGPLFTIGTGRSSNGTMDRLQIFLRNDDVQTVRDLYSTSVVFDDQWHHIAWVDVSGGGKLYVDGVQDATNFGYRTGTRGTRRPGYGTFTMDEVSLGAVLRATACCHFAGSLDDVRVYRFALSPSDVTAVMNNIAFNPCSASFGPIGLGCGPGPLTIIGRGSAGFGQTLTLELRKGTPNAPAFLCFGGGALSPLDISAIFTGCTLYPPNVNCIGIASLDAAGMSAPQLIPIPTDSTLRCTRVVFQGAVITLAPTGLELSHAIVAQLGN